MHHTHTHANTMRVAYVTPSHAQVGLPARGKTFLCTKIMRYLNWLGHETRHFNVGAYRRRHKAAEESDPHHTPHDADFFDHNNQVATQCCRLVAAAQKERRPCAGSAKNDVRGGNADLCVCVCVCRLVWMRV